MIAQIDGIEDLCKRVRIASDRGDHQSAASSARSMMRLCLQLLERASSDAQRERDDLRFDLKARSETKETT